MVCVCVEIVKVAVKQSLRLFPSGWRTLHHSLLGNNSRPPTTELVRGQLRRREGGQKVWDNRGGWQEMRGEERP